MKKSSKVLLLNLLDDDFREFISDVCRQYNIIRSTVPHITLRGPFEYEKKKPSSNLIKQINKLTDNARDNKGTIQIEGVGLFENGDTYIVYLDVRSKDILRPLTKKRDYSIKKHGFHPHVTILSTRDKNKAMQVKEALEKMNFRFHCKELDWQLHDLNVKTKNIFNLINAK
jgi:2'-5' RNA ligase